MRALLAFAFVTAMALAGCAGGGGGADTTGSDGTTGPGGTSKSGTSSGKPTSGAPTSGGPTSGGSPPPVGDRPPQGSIAASVVKGGVPLAVDFTLDGNDPDGRAVTWTLDVDGDGSADRQGDKLPTVANHTYTTAGVFNVTFRISDGSLSSSFNALINATGSSLPPSGQHFEGSFQSSTLYECRVGFRSETNNVTWTGMNVSPATVGKPFTATFTSSGQPICIGISWYMEDGSWIEDSGGLPTTTNTLEGTIPEGSVRALFFYVGGVNVKVTYDAQ